MKSFQQNTDGEVKNAVQQKDEQYVKVKTEEERLREAIYASDMEKFRLFTKMLKTNALFKRATVTQKQ